MKLNYKHISPIVNNISEGIKHTTLQRMANFCQQVGDEIYEFSLRIVKGTDFFSFALN